MRQAINSNPVVQIAVIGILVVVVGLFMMMNLKKKSGSSAASSSSAPTTAESSAAGTASPASPGATLTPAAPSTANTAPSTSGTVTPEALIPGPGLPQNVVTAWKGGDAIVLLIVRGGGIDDRLVRSSVHSLSGDRSISVFITRAKDIARYSRITQGVGVDRVPALVVVRPRQGSGSVPQAQVSYGFRDSQSVTQAVHDALYNGRDDLPYYPR